MAKKLTIDEWMKRCEKPYNDLGKDRLAYMDLLSENEMKDYIRAQGFSLCVSSMGFENSISCSDCPFCPVNKKGEQCFSVLVYREQLNMKKNIELIKNL